MCVMLVEVWGLDLHSRFVSRHVSGEWLIVHRSPAPIIGQEDGTESALMPSWFHRILTSCWRPFDGSPLELAGANSPVEPLSDALLWHADLKPHTMGDFSIAVVQANELLEDQSQVHTGPFGTYVGVYDGHGGPEASRFITNHLFANIQLFAREQGGISCDVLRKAVGATEEAFLAYVDRCWKAKPHVVAVGSCCLVGVISMNRLYVANLGDSRAVLGCSVRGYKGVVAQRISTEHNAGIEEVRRELKAQHPDDSHIVTFKHGVWRVKGIIQVSRSIGDVYLKKPELNTHPLLAHIGLPLFLTKPVLTAEPSIHEYAIHPQDRFLIFASDGLWEHLSEQEAANIVHSNPRRGIARRLIGVALQEVAKKREMQYSDLRKIERGVRRYFHDDISVVVVFLDHDLNRSSLLTNRSNVVSAPFDVFSLQAKGHSPFSATNE